MTENQLLKRYNHWDISGETTDNWYLKVSDIEKVLDDFKTYNKQLSDILRKQVSDEIVDAVLDALKSRILGVKE